MIPEVFKDRLDLLDNNINNSISEWEIMQSINACLSVVKW